MQCAARHFLMLCHWPLSQLPKILSRDFRWSCVVVRKHAALWVPHEEIHRIQIKAIDDMQSSLLTGNTVVAPTCYLTWWLHNNIAICCKIFPLLREVALAAVWDRDCVSARWSCSTLQEGYVAGFEFDIFKTVDWTWRIECMAPIVAWSKSDGFSLGILEKARLRSLSQDYLNYCGFI